MVKNVINFFGLKSTLFLQNELGNLDFWWKLGHQMQNFNKIKIPSKEIKRFPDFSS